jgi:cyanophycinase-like exopeptidase
MVTQMTQNVKPVYLLAGGRPTARKRQKTLLEMVYRDFGVASPTIAYSGTASGDDRNFFGFISAELKGAGAGEITHAVIAPDGADLEKARAVLAAADIVFVSGGDVSAGMDVLREKDMLGFLTGLYRQGKPFFGISAGAIMLAEKWVRWPDPDDENSAELFPCLGFAPIICDTHDEEGGWGELQAALKLEKEGVRGYGLASGSGVRVTPDGKVQAIGGTVYQYIRRRSGVERIEDLLP